MVFSSTIFLFLFLPLVLLIYYNPWFKTINIRNKILLLVSLIFYAVGEPRFIVLLLLSVIIGWYAALQIEKSKSTSLRKWLLIAAVSIHILVLFIFKYLVFTITQLNSFFGSHIQVGSIILPLGISFFTFQILSYLFDVYNKKVHAQKSLLNLALYISMFPQLVAGPIVRYDLIEQQILNRRESIDQVTEGMLQFIYGLAKKVIIADYIAQVADNIFNAGLAISVGSAWLGAIAYTLQIYFDFSGYSDMAIGLGKIFGFRFAENFNYPYISRSITEFWRRWHISLGSWFRDYVYIPLGGNRVSVSRWILNLLIVWSLTGIWHGANYTFWLWGMMYFILLIFEHYIDVKKYLGVFSHVYTLFWVILGWVLFRSESLSSAVNYMGMMFGHGSNGLTDNIFYYYLYNSRIILLLGILLSTPIYRLVCDKFFSRKNFLWIEPFIAILIFLVILVLVIGSSYHPFIYFNF